MKKIAIYKKPVLQKLLSLKGNYMLEKWRKLRPNIRAAFEVFILMVLARATNFIPIPMVLTGGIIIQGFLIAFYTDTNPNFERKDRIKLAIYSVILLELLILAWVIALAIMIAGFSLGAVTPIVLSFWSENMNLPVIHIIGTLLIVKIFG